MDYAVSERKAGLVQSLLAHRRLDDETPIAAVIDLDDLRSTIGRLHGAFPEGWMHAFAAKANAAVPVLKESRLLGMACEVASEGELDAALAAGFEPTRMIYDGPAKTMAELRRALRLGIDLNIDNFQELQRVEALMASAVSRSSVGIRINPQVGAGSIVEMSTATTTSKFGIGLEDTGNRDRLIEAYRQNLWLTAMHVHVGSQGVPMELAIQGIGKVASFAQSINEAVGRRKIVKLDIGGGLPVNFDDDRPLPEFAAYASKLEEAVPALFSGEFKVVTEFGRAVIAKAGFMVARVEYTKVTGGRPIAITHAGAQVATRTVFMPKHWPVRVSALDREGRPKKGDVVAQDIAGPCCFAGDLVATERSLPRLEPGDLVMIHDTGGYYFSTPFFYNSLPKIPVIGMEGHGSALRTSLLDGPSGTPTGKANRDRLISQPSRMADA